MTFRFQKQAGIQGSVLTYITIADAMVNQLASQEQGLPSKVIVHSLYTSDS